MEKYQKTFLGLMLKVFIGLMILIPTIIWLAPKPPHQYTGVVMEGKPSKTWVKEKNSYSMIETVKVFSSELGTVTAIVRDPDDEDNNCYCDYDLITNRDSYPPAIGKFIRVKLKYNDNKLVITKIWAE